MHTARRTAPLQSPRAGGTRGGWRPEGGGHGNRRALHIPIRHRRDRPSGVPIAVNFAPMIDVTFLLLIFFLVTTTFERAEGILSSELPRDEGAPAVALPVSPIVIRLTQTGTGHDDFRLSLDHFQNAPASSKELATTLRRIQRQPGFDKRTPVVIVAENAVRWDHVVGCWNAALRAGCERIAFAEP